MLARYARRFLLIEFSAYGLAAAVLLELRTGGWVVLAAVLGFALLMRCVAVAGTFVLAAALSRADDGTPPSTVGRFRLVATEIVWTTLAYSVLMPFPRAFGRPDSRLSGNSGTLPVLLLHGYLCNRAIWARMRRFLEANSVPTYTHDLEPVYASIDDYAAALARRIEDICSKSGAVRLIIVGHSMGGLAARACLSAGGSDRVAKLITLGTPHRGTRTAPMGLGPNARQMEPGSAWLESLARAESLGAPVPITSIYSSDDNVVVPQASSVLEQARNIRLSGIGHVSLPFSRIVQEIVLEAMRTV